MQHLKKCRSVSGYFQFKSKTVANVKEKKGSEARNAGGWGRNLCLV
jgi:hypothetical protein